MSGRVQDKQVIVFGAGSSGPGWGNGKAAAVLYAREGARVVCVDVDPVAAQETVGLIQAEGGQACAFEADVTDSARVATVVDQAHGWLGRVDVLHNNVGMTSMGGPIEETEASWQRILDLNLTSAFLTCKHVLPLMLAQGAGAIVNISSLAGLRYTGYPYASYYAAKAGLQQLTVGIALQYARQGIRANCVAPGLMNTPLIRKQIAGQYASPEEMIRARDAMSPTGKMGDAWDIAQAAVFLASDDAKFINGVTLPVDGGHHMTIR
jgi:NAD(P)-dependent dehydrogenase (short-subunit alcohol dehydrogenase family)